MHKNTLAFVIVAAIGGFVAGFWLANSINRSAGTTTTSTAPAANSGATTASPETELTDAEIKAKIAEADQSPGNLSFQRDLGISLYRYAAMKQNPELLGDAVRILERADSLKKDDFDILVALGNAHFDIGFFKKDVASFQRARDIYAKALAVRPGEPDVSTDLGISYFVQEPPDLDKAAAELERVSKGNPKHERSLQFLVQVYAKQKKVPQAEAAFAKLKAINPSSSALTELTAMISSAGGTAK
ncbi:MAG TPA: tetratricopeptide repeat protein [Pyrinomonadaceae bacterium]|nr:tetratricopeptide repeat protein [Acidobacteriota bacterium]HQZ98290.1 tetratricopeptide repeat protein [Pyrinomonadaceae bacterium]